MDATLMADPAHAAYLAGSQYDLDDMKRQLEAQAADVNKRPRWSPGAGGAAPSAISYGGITAAQQAVIDKMTGQSSNFDPYAYGFSGAAAGTSTSPSSAQLSGQQQAGQFGQQRSASQSQGSGVSNAAVAAAAHNYAAGSNAAFGGLGSQYGMGMMGYGGYGQFGQGFNNQSANASSGMLAQQQQQSPQLNSQATMPALNLMNPMLNLGMMNGLGSFTGLGAAGMGGFGGLGQQAGLGVGTVAQGQNGPGRTVYVGNLPPDASVDELLNLVKFGPLESVRVLPEKSCAFLSFLDPAIAAQFHADATARKITLQGQELKIGWGKHSNVPGSVMLAVQQSAASRNVYLGNIDEATTEETLATDLSRFGPIDQVKIVRDKNIAFVHYLSISTAMKVVSQLPTEPAWAGKRVNYGKDRCAYVPKSQQNNANNNQNAQVMRAAGYPYSPLPSASLFGSFNAAGGFPGGMPGAAGAFDAYGAAGGNQASAAMLGIPMEQIGNRTIYLGNLSEETTVEELCNAIRGGILHSIRYLPEKHIAFVTFIDATNAFTFYQVATFQGITIHNRRLKVGWGKHSGPLSPQIALAVQNGATRNVYIGSITDFDKFSEERLRRDFEEFGEVEQVNSLREKGCTFVNFTNIGNAIKAIDAMRGAPEYVAANLKISFGKDRCGNPPRSVTGGGRSRMASPPANAAPTSGAAAAAPAAPTAVGESGAQDDIYAEDPYPSVPETEVKTE